MKPKGNWVLVRFGTPKAIYNIVPTHVWNRWAKNEGRPDNWEEVARGTQQEVEALAKLMPDPKTLTFN